MSHVQRCLLVCACVRHRALAWLMMMTTMMMTRTRTVVAAVLQEGSCRQTLLPRLCSCTYDKAGLRRRHCLGAALVFASCVHSRGRLDCEEC